MTCTGEVTLEAPRDLPSRGNESAHHDVIEKAALGVWEADCHLHSVVSVVHNRVTRYEAVAGFSHHAPPSVVEYEVIRHPAMFVRLQCQNNVLL